LISPLNFLLVVLLSHSVVTAWVFCLGLGLFVSKLVFSPSLHLSAALHLALSATEKTFFGASRLTF